MEEFVIVSPEQFRKSFLDEIVRNERLISDLWFNKKKYTSLIKDQKDSILELTAKSLGLFYKSEYWTMDSIFYKEQDKENFDYGFYVSYVSVGVEHENDRNGSQGEMNKLALWNLPLGVLITYRNQGADKFYLDSYSDIVRKSNWTNNSGKERELLVIFGDKKGSSLIWDFFAFKDGRFEKF